MKLLNYDYFITKGYSSTNGNMRCVAYLLDTKTWGTEFGNENAKYVIGGPTIELLFASYNHKMNTTFESQAANSNGYVIRRNSTEGWQERIDKMFSTSDSLYVITSNVGAQGYFISSPSPLAGGAYIMRICTDGTINNWGGSTTYLGFRPVVCLNSNVNLKVSGESYEIITSN